MNLTAEINAISDSVLQLEQANERLKLQLQSKSNEPDARDVFIGLIAPDVEFYESKYQQTTDRMRKIVDAYRVVRPHTKD